jgi:hypothetical protein
MTYREAGPTARILLIAPALRPVAVDARSRGTTETAGRRVMHR